MPQVPRLVASHLVGLRHCHRLLSKDLGTLRYLAGMVESFVLTECSIALRQHQAEAEIVRERGFA